MPPVPFEKVRLVAPEVGMECSSAFQLPSWGLLNRSRPLAANCPLFQLFQNFIFHELVAMLTCAVAKSLTGLPMRELRNITPLIVS